MQKYDASTVAIETCCQLTEKSLVVSFGTFFQIFSNQGELERTETTKNFC